MKLKIFPLLTLLVLAGCTTHGSFVTEQKDAWFNDPRDGLFYCRANIKDNGLADPVCFEAGLHRYDEVSKENSENKKSPVK